MTSFVFPMGWLYYSCSSPQLWMLNGDHFEPWLYRIRLSRRRFPSRREKESWGQNPPSQLFPKAAVSFDVEPCERKKIRQPEWGCMLDSWSLLRQCIITGVVSMYLACTNLPIWKRLIWIYLDALHDPKGWPSQAMPIHHDPSDHTSPMGNTGSGWTRSLIPRDFLVPKVHVHSFGFPKRVGHFKMVGLFPKKRSGEHVHCLIEDSPVVCFSLELNSTTLKL